MKKKKKVKIIITPRFRKLRIFTIINLLLLAVNTASYFFVSRYSVELSQASDILYCLKICPVGETCNVGICANPPSVTTSVATNIAESQALGNGSVDTNGGSDITERGFVLALHSSPTTADTKFIVSGTTGSLTQLFTSLSSGITYYYRVYATNGAYTSYGEVASFTTASASTTGVSSIWGASGAFISPLYLPLGLIPKEEMVRNLNPNLPSEPPEPVYNTIKNIQLSRGVSMPVNIPVNLARPVQAVFPNTYITFQGETNIKDAIIIIRSNMLQGVNATTVADSEGKWKWIVPKILPPGNYSFTALAMSPVNANVRHTARMKFFIEPQKKIFIPYVFQPRKNSYRFTLISENITPTNDENTTVDEKTIVMETKIQAPEEGLFPTNQIALDTKIINLDGKKKIVPMEATIKDSQGKTVAQLKKNVSLKGIAKEETRFVMDKRIMPGEYVATTEMNYDDKKVISSDSFTVVPGTITLPSGFTINIKGLEDGLFSGIFILTVMLIIFFILFYREYIRSKNASKIAENDLWTDKEII